MRRNQTCVLSTLKKVPHSTSRALTKRSCVGEWLFSMLHPPNEFPKSAFVTFTSLYSWGESYWIRLTSDISKSYLVPKSMKKKIADPRSIDIAMSIERKSKKIGETGETCEKARVEYNRNQICWWAIRALVSNFLEFESVFRPVRFIFWSTNLVSKSSFGA